MIVAWRICAERYADDPLSGHGAFLFGGRWNSRGVRMVYAATSRALAILELRVHTATSTAPTDHVMIPLEVDPDLLLVLEPDGLPAGWRRYPAPASLAAFGDQWAREGRSVGLLVPSAVVPEEQNLLLNPGHADISRVWLGDPTPFVYDTRLF